MEEKGSVIGKWHYDETLGHCDGTVRRFYKTVDLWCIVMEQYFIVTSLYGTVGFQWDSGALQWRVTDCHNTLGIAVWSWNLVLEGWGIGMGESSSVMDSVVRWWQTGHFDWTSGQCEGAWIIVKGQEMAANKQGATVMFERSIVLGKWGNDVIMEYCFGLRTAVMWHGTRGCDQWGTIIRQWGTVMGH